MKKEEIVIELYELWNQFKARFNIISPQPKSFLLSKTVVPVTSVDGVKLKVVDLTSTTDVASMGTGVYTLQPTEGYIWKIKLVNVYIPDPAGSGAGATEFQLKAKNAADCASTGSNYLIYIASDFGTATQIGYNQLVTGTSKVPGAASDQMTMLTSLIVSHAHPMEIRYYNGTDVNQAADIEIIFWVEETPERL